MWICESGTQIEKAGLDLGTIKSDIHMLLEGTQLDVNGIKFIFQKKDVIVEKGGAVQIVSSYAINHATKFVKCEAELFIGIVSNTKINIRELKNMDVCLKKEYKAISGDFFQRIEKIESILKDCKDETRIFIFYIEKECCLAENKKENGIWKPDTRRYNMGGLEKHFHKLIKSPYFRLLYKGEKDVNNR